MKFKLPVDVCTPAGVAKMLIKDSNKLSSKDLKQGRCNRVFLLLTLICMSTLLAYQINHLCSVFVELHACMSLFCLCNLHFSNVLWQHDSTAKEADKRSPVHEKGSTRHEGGANKSPQMVGLIKY